MKLTYYGHSVFMIENNDFKGIIDPFITGNPLCSINIDEIKNLTHVFITHGHGDHLGDCIELARKNNALVISNAEICDYLSKKGINTHAMHIGGRHQFNFGRVKLTVALHGSGIDENGIVIDGGNPCGFVIELAGKKVYHAGDTGLTLDMKLLEAESIDVALLPIGGNYTMDIEDAVKAVEFIKPSLAIPMHYNTFGLIKANPMEFKSLNKTCETLVLQSGNSIVI